MPSETTSWLYTGTSRAALFNELTKIASAAEEANKPHWATQVGKGILAAGVGTGLGVGAGMLIDRAITPVIRANHPQSLKAIKFILPIVGAAALYGEERKRQALDELYQKANSPNQE